MAAPGDVPGRLVRKEPAGARLAVDARLRELSDGAKGIDDFARAFFAGAAADAPARTYTFDSLCDALESIVPGDWSTYLRGWVDGHGELDTLAGLRQHGWTLAYAERPTATFRQHEAEDGIADLSYSLGLKVSGNGVVRAVSWEGPAFQARLAPGSRILEVHGEPFSNARLLEAVKRAGLTPVRLLVEYDDGRRETRTIPYSGTLRYPRLVRIDGTADTLSQPLSPCQPQR